MHMKPTETLYYWHTRARLMKVNNRGLGCKSCYNEAIREIKKFPWWERLWFWLTNTEF